MNSKGYNKFQKQVKFDPVSTTKSENVDEIPIKDQQYNKYGRFEDNLSNSQISYSSKGFRQMEDNDSFQDEKTMTGSMKQQSLRRFILSEDIHKELNSQLKQSLQYTQQEKEQEQSSKKIVDLINSKQIYNNEYTHKNFEVGQEKSTGGTQLDEKTLQEECFINFHDLIKKSRTKISNQLQKFSNDKKTKFPIPPISQRQDMPEEILENLKLKRQNAWRGFVRKEDLISVLKSFGFFEIVQQKIFDQFIEKVKCYDKKTDGVNYMRLTASVYRYKSSISHLTKKFLTIDFKNGTKRMRAFRKYDEKPAVDIISQKYKEYRDRLAFKAEQKRLLELQRQQKLKDEPMSEQDKLKISMNESADNLISILREKISQSHRSLKDIFSMLDGNNDGFIGKEEFKLAFKKANIPVGEAILDEAYFRFDYNKDDKVSLNEFLNIILGQEKQVGTNAFQLQSVAEDIIQEIRKILLNRFNNRRMFLESLSAKNFNKITEDEFCAFLTQFTNNSQFYL